MLYNKTPHNLRVGQHTFTVNSVDAFCIDIKARKFKNRGKFYRCVCPSPFHLTKAYELLCNADGVVFVVDSQKKRLEENLISLQQLEKDITLLGRNIPIVIQWNKRDLDRDKIFSVGELQKKLNYLQVPSFEVVAYRGEGILKPLECLWSKIAFKWKDCADDFTPGAINPTEKSKPVYQQNHLINKLKKLAQIKGEKALDHFPEPHSDQVFFTSIEPNNTSSENWDHWWWNKILYFGLHSEASGSLCHLRTL